jgi:hypothetical protein
MKSKMNFQRRKFKETILKGELFQLELFHEISD